MIQIYKVGQRESTGTRLLHGDRGDWKVGPSSRKEKIMRNDSKKRMGRQREGGTALGGYEGPPSLAGKGGKSSARTGHIDQGKKQLKIEKGQGAAKRKPEAS